MGKVRWHYPCQRQVRYPWARQVALPRQVVLNMGKVRWHNPCQRQVALPMGKAGCTTKAGGAKHGQGHVALPTAKWLHCVT